MNSEVDGEVKVDGYRESGIIKFIFIWIVGNDS